MELKVHNIKGKETDKKVKLDKLVFGIEPNDMLFILMLSNILLITEKVFIKLKKELK